MPSSFVGRAAVLPRVSLVGAVAHISSDLFTEGIYGRSIRAYMDVEGCNRLLVYKCHFVPVPSVKQNELFLPSFDSMGRFFDASGQQIARSTVPYWPVQRASRDRSDQSLLTRCAARSGRSWSTLTLRRIWYLTIMPRPHPTATSRASQSLC